jgi:hypothetical protein
MSVRRAALVLLAAVASCEALINDESGSSDPGMAVDVGHLSADPSFFPDPAQFVISADNRTLYVAGRAAVGGDSSIFAFDLGARTLTEIVPHVVGLAQIAAAAGDEIVFRLATGEIRRAARNRAGSEPTSIGESRAPVAVSSNGRFIAYRQSGPNTDVLDLVTGARRSAPGDATPIAVRNDGVEVVFGACCFNPGLVNMSTGASRQFAGMPNLGSGLSAVAWVGDTLRALVLNGGGRETRSNGDYILPPSAQEVDIDLGKRRDLGTERVVFLTWAPARHRAASVVWASCTSEDSLSPCYSHAQDLFRLEGGKATAIGRTTTRRRITTSLMTSDGKLLIYYGDRLMLKALE